MHPCHRVVILAVLVALLQVRPVEGKVYRLYYLGGQFAEALAGLQKSAD